MNVRASGVLLGFSLLGLAAPAAALGGDSELMRKASVEGKYGDLLQKIEVPEDRDAYGEFNDWGYWDGTEWAGYTDLPAGYWVYVAPNWYIWGKERHGADLGSRRASVHGKYVHLLKKICVPQDESTYGHFNDWGYWDGMEWAGYSELPPGYWVYVAPNWYI